MNRNGNKSLVSFIVVISFLFSGTILYHPFDILSDADFLSLQLSFERPGLNYLLIDKKSLLFILSSLLFEYFPVANPCAFFIFVAPICHSAIRQDSTLRC
jgi:hypothetical protein